MGSDSELYALGEPGEGVEIVGHPIPPEQKQISIANKPGSPYHCKSKHLQQQGEPSQWALAQLS